MLSLLKVERDSTPIAHTCTIELTLISSGYNLPTGFYLESLTCAILSNQMFSDNDNRLRCAFKASTHHMWDSNHVRFIYLALE